MLGPLIYLTSDIEAKISAGDIRQAHVRSVSLCTLFLDAVWVALE